MLTLTQAADRLDEMEDVVFLCHAEPDGDTVGSSVALALGLRQLGKQTAICCADSIPQKYDYLSVDQLTLDFEPRFVVSVDVADQVLLGNLSSKYPKIDLAIDHHQSHRAFADEVYLDATGCACAMPVYDLLQVLKVDITPEIANALYTGLVTDSGCFLYSSTTPKAHQIAGQLMIAGADYTAINRRMFETKSFARLQLERACVDHLVLYHNNLCAISVLPEDVMEKTGALPGDIDGIAAIPRCVEGVEIGILLRQKQPGVYKASVRTNTVADASRICAALGGGGHLKAAGCSFEGTARAAADRLLMAAKDELLRLGLLFN